MVEFEPISTGVVVHLHCALLNTLNFEFLQTMKFHFYSFIYLNVKVSSAGTPLIIFMQLRRASSPSKPHITTENKKKRVISFLGTTQHSQYIQIYRNILNDIQSADPHGGLQLSYLSRTGQFLLLSFDLCLLQQSILNCDKLWTSYTLGW